MVRPCILFLALCAGAARAEGPTLPIPVQSGKLESTRVGEAREFWVSLPDGYNESGDRYPVVYLMDGEMNFTSGVIGGLRHAAQLGEIPDFILVGIRNTSRSRDVFPEEVVYGDGSKDGGRANPYLDFIHEELVPRIEKTYRTERFRVLYGTSNTGFTTVYALFRTPVLADAYIAASATLSVPSFRKEREKLVRDFKGGRRSLLLVMGEHDLPTVISQNGALKEAIAMSGPADLSCRLKVIRGGGHVPPDSLIEGLRDLFDGWKVTQHLTEATFPAIRAQVEGRMERFGLSGRLPEEALKELGETLTAARKHDKAIEVARYRAQGYPRSAPAQVSLGEAYLQAGQRDEARACFRQALALAPGHVAATARLKELRQ